MHRIGVFCIFSLVIRYSISKATHRYATLTAACDCGQNDTDRFVINLDVEQYPIETQLAYGTILRATFSGCERWYEIYLHADPTIKDESDCQKSSDEGSAKRYRYPASSGIYNSSKSYQSLFTGCYFFQFKAKTNDCRKCFSDRMFLNGSFEYEEFTVFHTYEIQTTNDGSSVERTIRTTVLSSEVALNVSLYSSRLNNSGVHDYRNTSASPMQCIVSFTDPLDEKTDNKSCTGEIKVRRDTVQSGKPGAVSFVFTSSEPRRPDYFYIVSYKWLDETGVIKELQGFWGVLDVWRYSIHDSVFVVITGPDSPSYNLLSKWAIIAIPMSSFGLITMIGIALRCMLRNRVEEPELEDTAIVTKASPRPGSFDVLFLYARETPEFDMLVESVKKKLGQSSNLQIHDFQTLEGYARISHLNLDDWIADWFKNDTKIVWFDTPMLRSRLSNKKQELQEVHDSRDRLLRVALTWAKHYHVEPTTRHNRDFVVRITGCDEYEVRGESDVDNPLSSVGQCRYYYIPDHLCELYEALVVEPLKLKYDVVCLDPKLKSGKLKTATEALVIIVTIYLQHRCIGDLSPPRRIVYTRRVL